VGGVLSTATTAAANWRKNGEADPHGHRYDCDRSQLAMGNLSDDELANSVFLHGDGTHGRAPVSEVVAGRAFWPIAWLTAAKDRIRWLSRKLVAAEATNAELVAALHPLLARFRDFDDAGPRDEGWQSEEFLAELAAADAAIKKAGGAS
jgi:hypothetical protein